MSNVRLHKHTMSLISCPECKAEVSDQAAACIRGGYPLQRSPDKPGSSIPAKSVLGGNPAYDNQPSAARGGFLDESPNYAQSSRREEYRPWQSSAPQIVQAAKSRGVFIILGLFFGTLGIHNFYAGYLGRGCVQLLVVLLLGWFIIGFVIVGLWVIVELFVTTKDAACNAMV